MAADTASSTTHKTAEAGRLGVRGRCGRLDGVVRDIPLDYACQTAAGKACAKPGAAPAASTAGIDMGGTAAAAAAKVVAGKVLKAADTLGRNHGLSQHTAAGVAYIDAQACHERVDFLRYLQEAYRTHEPDQDIAGNRLLTYSVHLSLHFFLGNGKSRLTKQAGEGSNHQRKEQNFLEFFQSAPPYKESGLAIKEPTMLVNRRRHQAFIISRKICPPSIRHQDFQIFDVVWLAPIEKATGAV